ncbi:DUF4184 family protein [Microbacterium sp. LRZ72]|uniref:DUF4184 family protein n=1 Tax=Microbacterium sp. LRZ72 TaxID=2942481 RepID=UPI0029B9CD52|nr:DUF4184 family protein [Microbacterium sp. LRZ72]MDX2375689.1 DUF4184 family protein [Microbacterium sp. LRZ72]
MPFTPSHAVVALPFVRTPLVPAAVAVGAMAPDLPLFVRGTGLSYALTHDLRWLPVTVVVALGLLVLWRAVLRPAARELAPRWMSARLPAEWDAGARQGVRETFAGGRGRIAALAVSVLIGVVSHVVWDLFTHEGRAGVRLLPALALEWGGQPLYGWLQDASSLLGLAILAVFGALWLGRRREGDVVRLMPDAVRWAWWLSLPAVLVVALIGGYLAAGPFHAGFGPAHLAYLVLPPACALWAAFSIVLALAVQLRRTRG